ncbi:MAG: molybdate ABC transporter permease subunit [Anaerohalosphaeraceae bacterium]
MLDAVWISLKVASVSMLVILVPGIALGWLLARRRFAGQSVLHSLLYLPMVIPPVVTGYLTLLVFGRQGWIGKWLDRFWGISLAFDWTGAVLVSSIVSLPLLVRSVKLSVEMIDRRLNDASAVLGATPVRTFCTITLPLAGPGIFAGLILAFARSLGEFGATVIFAGNIPGKTQTIALAVYSMIQTPGGDRAAMQLAAISVILAVLTVIASDYLERKMRAAGVRS